MYADALRKVQHHAKHLKDVIPDDASKILSVNNDITEKIDELKDQFKKRFTDAMVASFVETKNKSYQNMVLMGNSSSKFKMEIIPEYVIVSTTKELSKNTAIINVAHHNAHHWHAEQFIYRFTMIHPETFHGQGIINAYPSMPQVEQSVQDTLIDFLKAYEVVKGSVPFRTYLKDQFTNNIL
jgi:hypothetical protein